MSLTNDPNDPRLGHGVDEKPIPQHNIYLVLSDEERRRRCRPAGASGNRRSTLSETYACKPSFYGATFAWT